MMTKRWRLVCHSCGKKYPEGTAFNIDHADCCKSPNLHVHNLEEPCERCEDSTQDGRRTQRQFTTRRLKELVLEKEQP